MPYFYYSLIVGAGSFFGGMFRYLFIILFKNFSIHPVWSIVIINFIGSFVIAFLSEFLIPVFSNYPFLKYFLLAGVLGGFTTFSTFSLDMVTLLISKEFVAVAIQFIFGIFITLLATYLGLKLGKLL